VPVACPIGCGALRCGARRRRVCLTLVAAEVVHRAPITWLGRMCGVVLAMVVIVTLLLPFIYITFFK
jgi:hypothetical protein